jgi:hypothetical protein
MDCVKQRDWQPGSYTRVSLRGLGVWGFGGNPRPHTLPIKGNHRVITTGATHNFTPRLLFSSTAGISNCM